MDRIDAEAVYGGLALPVLSIPETALILLIVLPAAAVAGYWMGRTQRNRALAEDRPLESAAGETTLGGTLALLGLMLAFSFGHALTTFQARSHAVLVEANALSTAFLRADYLDGQGADRLQAALLTYAETRVAPRGGATRETEVRAFIARTLEAQTALWPLTVELTSDPAMPAAIRTFVAGAINEVLDAHTVRTQAFSVPLQPVTTTMTLSLAVIVLFLLGNRTAMHGRALTWRTFVFSAMLWVVMLTILDTQRSEHGIVTVDNGPLYAAILDMRRGHSASADAG